MSYETYAGELPVRTKGAMISMENGTIRGYALDTLQERGILMVAPGDETYEGMIIGMCARGSDMVVNPTKGKQLTNIRASGSDENIILTPAKHMTLEQAIDYIEDDELVGRVDFHRKRRLHVIHH